jgi:general secretion pathway protein H
MRTSVTGTRVDGCSLRRGGGRVESCPPEVRSAGFTLVELLVVLVLVAILAGFAVLAVRGRDAQELVDEDAERFFALLTLVQEEVLFRYRTVGVWLSQSGYRFLAYTEGGWEPSIDPLLGERILSEGVGFRLYLEGRPVVLDLDGEEKQDEDGEPLPQLVFFPDGEMTPFEIVVESERAVARTLRGTPTGRLTIERDDAAD